jgi:hypothetical protein
MALSDPHPEGPAHPSGLLIGTVTPRRQRSAPGRRDTTRTSRSACRGLPMPSGTRDRHTNTRLCPHSNRRAADRRRTSRNCSEDGRAAQVRRWRPIARPSMRALRNVLVQPPPRPPRASRPCRYGAGHVRERDRRGSRRRSQRAEAFGSATPSPAGPLGEALTNIGAIV